MITIMEFWGEVNYVTETKKILLKLLNMLAWDFQDVQWVTHRKIMLN